MDQDADDATSPKPKHTIKKRITPRSGIVYVKGEASKNMETLREMGKTEVDTIVTAMDRNTSALVTCILQAVTLLKATVLRYIDQGTEQVIET